MKDRPILFSPTMAAAIRAGKKTVTRRIIRESFMIITVHDPEVRALFHCSTDASQRANRTRAPTSRLSFIRGILTRTRNCQASTLNSEAKCPFGKPGDTLWVREEHYRWGHWIIAGKTKTGRAKWRFVPEDDEVRYSESPPPRFRKSRDKDTPHIPCWYKRLARFMPKKFCRTRVRIQSISVEALHDITGIDAIREGVGFGFQMNAGWPDYRRVQNGICEVTQDEARMSYATLWDSINGEGSWETNPWVWRVKFELVKG